MNLRKKLASQGKVISPLSSLFKPKKEVTPEAMWQMLAGIAEDVMKRQMQAFEQRMEKKAQAVEEAAYELLTMTHQLKGQVDTDLANHIATRSVEIQGEKGEKGDTVVGPQGPQGQPGLDGKDGQSIVGPAGKDGKNGKDGSPDTGDQIISKVNASDKFIDRSRVRGLEDALKNIARGGAKKGGGMGNWVHEGFPVTSATTSVTIGARPAANGMAHLLRYNGQVLAYGSQYTLSDKTFSFTFTLDDDSTVDISYVR